MEPKNTFTATVLKQVSKHINFPGLFLKFPRQHRENLFRGWQNWKKCLEEQTKEKDIPREKKVLFQFFEDFERSVFTISENLLAWLSKLQSKHLCKVLRNNIFIWKMNMISTFFGLWDEKEEGFQWKSFLRGSYNKNSRFQWNFLRKKIFLFRKSFIFLLSFFELEWFLCLFAIFFCLLCQTANQREERKKNEEINL